MNERHNEPDDAHEPHRISVVVAEAGTQPQWKRWKTDWSKHRQEPVMLVQSDSESGSAFAQRVASSVARLGRQRAVLERLALIVRDDFTPAMGVARSEVLSLMTLHLVKSRTPLTIRFASDEESAEPAATPAE